jgi:hypothetical protein
VTDKKYGSVRPIKAPLRCGTNARAAVWSDKIGKMGKKLPKKPKGRGTPSPRRVRRTALELVVKEAAADATKLLQQLKDSQPKYAGTTRKIPASELTLNLIDVKRVAATFKPRLAFLNSTVHALHLRLCKWRNSGERDPVPDRGRPRTTQLTPLKSLAIASAINSSEAHLSAAQVGAISSNMLGGMGANKRQQRQQRKDLRNSHRVIRGLSKGTVPALLHASSSKILQFKMHADLSAEYDACPTFESNPEFTIIKNAKKKSGKRPHALAQARLRCCAHLSTSTPLRKPASDAVLTCPPPRPSASPPPMLCSPVHLHALAQARLRCCAHLSTSTP